MRRLLMLKRLVSRHCDHSFLKDIHGSVYVEFSVGLSSFLVLLLFVAELCSATYTRTVLADAANEAVHYAIVHGTDEAGITAMAKAYAASTLNNTSGIDVSVSYPDGTSTPPARIAVNVSYRYVPYLGLVMANPPTMHAYAEGMTAR